MPATRHIAEITDPVTGEQTTLTAHSAAELEQLVDEHLAHMYPQPTDPPGCAR